MFLIILWFFVYIFCKFLKDIIAQCYLNLFLGTLLNFESFFIFSYFFFLIFIFTLWGISEYFWHQTFLVLCFYHVVFLFFESNQKFSFDINIYYLILIFITEILKVSHSNELFRIDFKRFIWYIFYKS